jgi:hypothetical protein
MFLFHFNIIPDLRFSVPRIIIPHLTWQSIISGLIILAIPQIPLSLGNSIFATHQIAHDLFPEKKVTVRKIALTYSLMNLISPLLGGIPVCHGSGGIAGHYTLGGRTGGSTLIYGLFYLILGLFFSGNSVETLMIFPKPILGTILLFEGFAMILLVKDIIVDRNMFLIAIIVAICAVGLPNGYLIGMVLGTFIYYFNNKFFLKNFGKQ